VSARDRGNGDDVARALIHPALAPSCQPWFILLRMFQTASWTVRRDFTVSTLAKLLIERGKPDRGASRFIEHAVEATADSIHHDQSLARARAVRPREDPKRQASPRVRRVGSMRRID
jgi:hypothetical protein